MSVSSVADSINFAAAEEKILSYWKEIDAFRTSVKLNKHLPRYTFYDGPPFATGLPHYGNLLAGTMKDIVTRYAHQSGYYVERRFGWDCHGLPVEFEIDKENNITGPEDVAKMGIKAYNNKCRAIVMRYAHEWEEIVGRMGRWIDFENDYKTLYPSFMESVWWAFKQLFNKGLVYRGVKVMPYSTGCNTPLSNFESGQNYKEVIDPAVIVSFPLDEDPDVHLVAWTTTPWTLPSNLAVCVNPDMDYVKIHDHNSGLVLLLMEARLEILYKSPDDYTVVDRLKGKQLEGKSYKPLFEYFAGMKEKKGAFRVCCDGYVTSESGTGVVHQAPYFGEDDNRVCLRYGIITRDMEPICPVDASGKFTSEATHFAGQYVKDADKHIIKHLKEHYRLIHQSTTKHSYPFCWRSETPLIYKAVPSWFIRVEPLVESLLANNAQTYWVPTFVQEKRFANWLRDARDWAVSRNRYWGTPVPLWVGEDGKEVVCVGSIAELEALSGHKVDDLHRDVVDDLTIPSLKGDGSVLRRVSEVFDCWFESGSMPYAQVHYPFENRREFEDCFPADFIAEGIDQTRGWFYTLLVLSTALFGKPPFKNLIVNGLVLATDGSKMSKRKKNYPDPMYIIGQYGADALRLYLINSPVVRGENLRFREEGVRDVLKDVFLPWYNAYRFLIQNIQRLEKEDGIQFQLSAGSKSDTIMDRWILSFTNSLVSYVHDEMKAYHLYTVVPRLVKYVDTLTNWYVRMNRRRLKGEISHKDCIDALQTLTSVLLTMVRLMAPFTPFLSELMYQNLKKVLPADLAQDSVHYLRLPQTDESLIDPIVELRVSLMQAVVELARVIRERNTIPLKYPVREVVVVHAEQDVLKDVQFLESFILDEVNARQLTTSADKAAYGVKLRAEPDHKTLGARLKGEFKKVMEAVKKLTDAELSVFLDEGNIVVCGHDLCPEDIRVMYSFDDDELREKYEANSDNQILVLLDIRPDQTMLDEGLGREIVNRIQKLRKKAKLVPSDNVIVYADVSPPESDLARVRADLAEFITSSIKQPLGYHKDIDVEASLDHIIAEDVEIKGNTLRLTIVRRADDEPRHHIEPPKNAESVRSSEASKSVEAPTSVQQSKNGPFCPYINIIEATSGQVGTVLLQNPAGMNPLSYDSLLTEVRNMFGLWTWNHVALSSQHPDQPMPIHQRDLVDLPGKTVFVYDPSSKVKPSYANAKGVQHIVGGGDNGPAYQYVNIESADGALRSTLLLENRNVKLTGDMIRRQIEILFGDSAKIGLSKDKPEEADIILNNIKNLNGRTIYIL